MGKENIRKIEYLTLSDFQREVIESYRSRAREENSGPWSWYNEERKKHPTWPPNPQKAYEKQKGWMGLPELLGVENRLKKIFLPFADFRREVISAYSGEESITEWYKKEQKNHQNWPSLPGQMYKDSGWEGWLKLFGRKKRIWKNRK